MSQGEIVGAAIVSHHPGLFQTEEFRIAAGDGRDSDLIPGFRRLREKIDVSGCLLYTSPSPRDLSTSRMPSSA